jgi:probable rRNA maturation factor
MDISYSDEQDDPLPGDWLIDVARVAMRAESLPDSTQLAVTMVNAERMADLNREYLGRSGPTDVLSFPIEDFSGGTPERDEAGPPLLLGDIFVCPAVVRNNAAMSGVRFEDEMALMIVHGFLHLLGRDHVLDEEAEAMEQREREILAMMGRERP